MEKHENGHIKWLVLGATIVALEWLPNETLSNAFRRGIESRWGKLLIPIGVVATVGHLYDVIPDNLDVYDYLGRTKAFVRSLTAPPAENS